MDLKCKECGATVDGCESPHCRNHSSGGIKEGEEIFCTEGMHYCERQCLVDEYEQSIKGIISEAVKDE